MEQKNNSRNYDVQKKQYNRKDRSIEGNTTKWNKRVRSDIRTKERRWTNLKR